MIHKFCVKASQPGASRRLTFGRLLGLHSRVAGPNLRRQVHPEAAPSWRGIPEGLHRDQATAALG